ncbi:GNAT family N-acetyltransferase [Qipengyuania sp. DSG2-2]|uniref:GNAT family N-acetyltransferase n=1 Tax=Qipengyuania sp. DGS2-2 TaxID=3349631 RepID=UPI0036D3F606
MQISIRQERPGDERAIRTLTDAAFKDMPFSDGDEGPLVEKLREDGDLVLSLVAVDDGGSIVGHIGFSPITIEQASGPWFQLSPVSVVPAHQHSGIGSALIEEGARQMAERGAHGIALVGNPAYYGRFGFILEHEVTLSQQMDPVLQIKTLQGDPPSGQLTLAPAFG